MQNAPWRSLCAAALFLATSASAGVVAFEFCGHVSGSNPMARDGTPVVGRFSWDTSAPLSPSYPGATQSYYSEPYTRSFSFIVGPHRIATDSVGVVVWNDTGSNVADMIDINGYSPVIDGTLFRDGYFSIRLASGPTSTSVFQDMRLPDELDVARFDSIGMNYFQMYSGTQANELLLDVDLAWIRRADAERPGESERRLCLPRAARQDRSRG